MLPHGGPHGSMHGMQSFEQSIELLVQKIPICGNPDCRKPLQESSWIQLVRFCYINPVFLMAIGIALAVVPFLFLDRYVPRFDLVANIMIGRVGGLEYRYILSLAVSIFLLGGFLWLKRER